MTALEMITTLRICGNHPSMDGNTCDDCPYKKTCDDDKGGARINLEAADTIEALMKEVAQLRAGIGPEWISTEDCLPEPHKPVIVARPYEKGKPLKVEQGYFDGTGWWKVFGTNCKRVPYWMPMPEPPEEET